VAPGTTFQVRIDSSLPLAPARSVGVKGATETVTMLEVTAKPALFVALTWK
jgi:hypothetical protein